MELKIVSRQMVKPAEATWTGTQALTELDQIGVTTHGNVIFFYPGPIATPFEAMIDMLVESLGRALVRFYPLAGRLRSLGPGGRFELVCNAEGAVFVAAELKDAELSDLGDFTPTSFFDEFLFPEIEPEPPLFLAQLTRFGYGGVSLALAMSHVVSDGRGAVVFISEWARLSRGGEGLLPVPFLDRTALLAGEPGPRFDHSEDFCCLPYLLDRPTDDEISKMRTEMVTLTLSRQQVEKLKSTANELVDTEKTRPFTRYESVAAHIWRSCTKARNHRQPRGDLMRQGGSVPCLELELGPPCEQQQTGCLVTVDVRRRVEPPIPREYFGNGSFDVTATCPASELARNPLSFGAGKIRAAIERVTSDYVQSAIGFLKGEADVTKFQYSYKSSKLGGGKFGGNPNVGVVDWVKLPLQGTDFGWGNEAHFGPGNHGVDGDSWIIGSKTGDGSLVVLICLLEHHVEAFERHFFNDI